MRVCVAVQVLQQVEAAATHVTAERLLSGVDDSMGLELRLFGETLSALQTLIWLLTGVRPHVDLHALPLTESSAANAAAERLLARVDAIMSLQVALRGEGFPAGLTHQVFPRDALQDKAWCAGSVLVYLQLRRLELSSFQLSSFQLSSFHLSS